MGYLWNRICDCGLVAGRFVLERAAKGEVMNALRRAKLTMEKYEAEREKYGAYPTAEMAELIQRAQAYALIAVAQEARAASNRAGDYTDPKYDQEYEA